MAAARHRPSGRLRTRKKQMAMAPGRGPKTSPPPVRQATERPPRKPDQGGQACPAMARTRPAQPAHHPPRSRPARAATVPLPVSAASTARPAGGALAGSSGRRPSAPAQRKKRRRPASSAVWVELESGPSQSPHLPRRPRPGSALARNAEPVGDQARSRSAAAGYRGRRRRCAGEPRARGAERSRPGPARTGEPADPASPPGGHSGSGRSVAARG
jgi:hypothetical protein